MARVVVVAVPKAYYLERHRQEAISTKKVHFSALSGCDEQFGGDCCSPQNPCGENEGKEV